MDPLIFQHSLGRACIAARPLGDVYVEEPDTAATYVYLGEQRNV